MDNDDKPMGHTFDARAERAIVDEIPGAGAADEEARKLLERIERNREEIRENGMPDPLEKPPTRVQGKGLQGMTPAAHARMKLRAQRGGWSIAGDKSTKDE